MKKGKTEQGYCERKTKKVKNEWKMENGEGNGEIHANETKIKEKIFVFVLGDGKYKVGGWTDWEKYGFPANV